MIPPPSVLVIDDSEVVLEMTAEMMRNAGLEPLGVSDAHQVASIISAKHPALVLVDLTLGDLSGEQVVKQILKRFPDGQFPVLLFSGHSRQELTAAAARCGADGVVLKSDGDSAFVKEVKRWIALFSSD